MTTISPGAWSGLGLWPLWRWFALSAMLTHGISRTSLRRRDVRLWKKSQDGWRLPLTSQLLPCSWFGFGTSWNLRLQKCWLMPRLCLLADDLRDGRPWLYVKIFTKSVSPISITYPVCLFYCSTLCWSLSRHLQHEYYTHIIADALLDRLHIQGSSWSLFLTLTAMKQLIHNSITIVTWNHCTSSVFDLLPWWDSWNDRSYIYTE